MRASDRHGFTLIELSIVLVIIGLIVGGILVGRDLIRTAELRADISAVDKFDVAVNTFRIKYNCLPGDCANATQFLEGAYNGDGNGVIDPSLSPGSELYGHYIGYEIAYAIDDMARAVLIAVAPFEANDPLVTSQVINALPRLPSGSAFIVIGEFHFIGPQWAGNGKHLYRLGVSPGPFEGNVQTAPAPYTPYDAYYIDSKIDDGKAAFGRVTASRSFPTHDLPLFMPASDDYFIGGICNVGADLPEHGLNDTCDYDLTLKDKLVGLFVRASF